ncbi:COX15/CtaA family protein [Prochlorococcus marinus]|uniref:COX15/CtaA family protein n=1 Tax=Prochlorococcus marinus TaxID=1219 RepID=UPI001ADAC136|nr:COX15/CtaA family protein [Prochlorococcus marinus]MBO8216776.1 heme A synthase [Prochlorococcus marinus XMU1405]MBW3039976.1 heme A synthase [Prochlorococcus marinus str. MU1405]MBW3047434.1 heme A synthase [Prochlorococcus marinus str. MU1406]
MINNQLYKSKYLTIFKRLGSHSVLALIALIVIGGATRVMEAGLACPDWPLCYGSFFPLNHMNLRVFLEWFHRLDAFLVGILILFKFALAIIWKNEIPNWLPKTYSLLLFLVIIQGSFGALTVINLLDSYIVTGHLLIAFLLLITTISINQNLENEDIEEPLTWWRLLLFVPLLLTLIQSFVGVRLSSTWSAHICLSSNKQCLILNTHKLFAYPIAFSILFIIATAIYKRSLLYENWKYLSSLIFLLFSQITLGVLSLKTNLNEPIFIIGHQLNASLFIAILTTLIFRNPFTKKGLKHSLNSQMVGINS